MQRPRSTVELWPRHGYDRGGITAGHTHFHLPLLEIRFELDYSAKYPKAVAKIVDDADVLLEFYRYPAEHWVHLRTTNPIESTFATVRLRTKVTKGPGSRAAGIAMAYKLIDAAQARWRAVNAPHLVALVRAGAVFHKGKLLERPIDITPAEPGGSTETEVA